MILHFLTADRSPHRPECTVHLIGSRTPSPWWAASTMPRESCVAWTPQLLPLVLHRAPPLCEEDIEPVVRPLFLRCTWLTCVQLVKPCTLAGVRSCSRACRSANSATKTHPAVWRRSTCLHGQLGPKQQRALARAPCVGRARSTHGRLFCVFVREAVLGGLLLR